MDDISMCMRLQSVRVFGLYGFWWCGSRTTSLDFCEPRAFLFAYLGSYRQSFQSGMNSLPLSRPQFSQFDLQFKVTQRSFSLVCAPVVSAHGGSDEVLDAELDEHVTVLPTACHNVSHGHARLFLKVQKDQIIITCYWRWRFQDFINLLFGQTSPMAVWKWENGLNGARAHSFCLSTLTLHPSLIMLNFVDSCNRSRELPLTLSYYSDWWIFVGSIKSHFPKISFMFASCFHQMCSMVTHTIQSI